MEQWHGKVALVTGASSGIGYEIAKQLVAHNIHVFATARRFDRLEALAESVKDEPGELTPIQLDITSEEDIKNAFKVIEETASGVDILINNAGITVPSSLCDGKTEDWLRVLNTNVVGLCMATREAIRSMNARDTVGHIIHINSVLGHRIPSFVGSKLNIYPATKHAVTALSESLRQELHSQHKNIKVTSLSPGLVQTEISVANDSAELIELLSSMKALDPIDIANAVIYVLSTPPHVLVSELTIRPLDEA